MSKVLLNLMLLSKFTKTENKFKKQIERYCRINDVLICQKNQNLIKSLF